MKNGRDSRKNTIARYVNIRTELEHKKMSKKIWKCWGGKATKTDQNYINEVQQTYHEHKEMEQK